MTIAWDPNTEPDIAGYRIAYGTQPGSHPTVIDAGNTTSREITSLTNGQRYYFVVMAYDGDGFVSLPSTEVSAAVWDPFADHPLILGVTPVRAVHFYEIRNRISELRVFWGLGPVAWTNPVLTAATPVLAAHLNEMRTALGGVYAAAGRAQPVYTHPTIQRGTPIRAIDLAELRSAVNAMP